MFLLNKSFDALWSLWKSPCKIAATKESKYNNGHSYGTSTEAVAFRFGGKENFSFRTLI
jgi:hypothetical protein